MEYIYELNQIDEVAQQILKQLKHPTILFYGDLGAGKTTLIKALVKALGSDDSVSSPTFSLINEYKNQDGDTIYHLDLYRLKEENEAYDIGIEEILDSGGLKFIEWPQKINNLIDDNVHSAKISSINESKRKLEFI